MLNVNYYVHALHCTFVLIFSYQGNSLFRIKNVTYVCLSLIIKNAVFNVFWLRIKTFFKTLFKGKNFAVE